jgi:hypothetical protein
MLFDVLQHQRGFPDSASAFYSDEPRFPIDFVIEVTLEFQVGSRKPHKVSVGDGFYDFVFHSFLFYAAKLQKIKFPSVKFFKKIAFQSAKFHIKIKFPSAKINVKIKFPTAKFGIKIAFPTANFGFFKASLCVTARYEAVQI